MDNHSRHIRTLGGIKMIQTKMDAVKRLAFFKKAYDKVRGYGFKDSKGNPVDMCGVISFSEYVFITNNHFMGRIKVQDGKPAREAKYWDLNAEDEETALKEVPSSELIPNRKDKYQEKVFFSYNRDSWEDNEPYQDFSRRYIKSFNQSLNSWKDNMIKLDKNYVLSKLDEKFGRNENLRAKFVILAQILPEEGIVAFRVMPTSKKTEEEDFVFTIPIHLAAGRDMYSNFKPPAICSVNCYYFYYMLQAFEEYDYVDLAFDNKNFNNRDKSGLNLGTVMLKATNEKDEKPDIRFVIAQSKSERPHPESDLY